MLQVTCQKVDREWRAPKKLEMFPAVQKENTQDRKIYYIPGPSSSYSRMVVEKPFTIPKYNKRSLLVTVKDKKQKKKHIPHNEIVPVDRELLGKLSERKLILKAITNRTPAEDRVQDSVSRNTSRRL